MHQDYSPSESKVLRRTSFIIAEGCPQQRLIEDLREELSKGDVLVVAGTGVSIQASGNSPCASWNGLISDGIEHCVQTNLMTEAEAAPLRKQLAGNSPAKMIKVAETVSKTLGAPSGGEFLRWLQRSVGKLPLKDRTIVDAIHELNAPIATTNYDDLLTRGRGIDAVPWTSPVAPEIIRSDREAVLHLHGYYLDPESVILGVSSYDNILADPRAQALEQALIIRSTLLFIGSGDGLLDPNFGALLEWSTKAIDRSIYRHYCLCRSSERATLQKRFPEGARLFYIGYGDDYGDLAPFLRRDLVPFAKRRKPLLPTLPPAGFCIGRDAEVEEVVATLLADKPQPLPILGGPGMGKTTIALTALHDKRVADRFGSRRWFIRCDGVKTRQELAAAIAQAMGIRISSIVEPEVLAALAEIPAALLIDNAETALDAAKDDVVQLLTNLSSIESLALIVTIRGQKRPAGIPWRSTMKAERLDLSTAREVFVTVSGKRQFAADPDLDKLLGVLEGTALAITLMARYAEAYETLDLVWSRWHAKHTAMLNEGRDRLTNLAVSYELSIAVLSSTALRLLSVLAMLPDGIAETDLPALFADAEDAAHELRGRALIFDEGKRLRMLAPLREHVAVAHPASNDDEVHVVDHYLRLADVEGHKVGAAGGSEAVSRLTPETGNVESMLLRSGRDGYRSIAHSVVGWAEFMRFTGLGSVRVVEALARRAKESGNLNDTSRCIKSLGDITFTRSDYDRARAHYEEALPLYRKLGDSLGEADCISRLGEIVLRRLDYDEARARFEQALLLFQEFGNLLGEATCIKNLGVISLLQSDYDGAQARYEQALALYQKADSVLGEAHCNGGLGGIALARSDYDGARVCFEKALALYQKVGDLQGEANCLQQFGDIALARSDYDDAQVRYEAALPMYQKVGDLIGEANCIQSLGDIALGRGDFGDARAFNERALRLFQKIGHLLGEANCTQSLGDIAYAMQDHNEAMTLYRKSLALFERMPDPYSIGIVYRRLARLADVESRDAYVAAARMAWQTIKRDDLIAELDKDFGPETN